MADVLGRWLTGRAIARMLVATVVLGQVFTVLHALRLGQRALRGFLHRRAVEALRGPESGTRSMESGGPGLETGGRQEGGETDAREGPVWDLQRGAGEHGIDGTASTEAGPSARVVEVEADPARSLGPPAAEVRSEAVLLVRDTRT